MCVTVKVLTASLAVVFNRQAVINWWGWGAEVQWEPLIGKLDMCWVGEPQVMGLGPECLANA